MLTTFSKSATFLAMFQQRAQQYPANLATLQAFEGLNMEAAQDETYLINLESTVNGGMPLAVMTKTSEHEMSFSHSFKFDRQTPFNAAGQGKLWALQGWGNQATAISLGTTFVASENRVPAAASLLTAQSAAAFQALPAVATDPPVRIRPIAIVPPVLLNKLLQHPNKDPAELGYLAARFIMEIEAIVSIPNTPPTWEVARGLTWVLQYLWCCANNLLPTISPCAITNPRALQHVTQCQDLHLTAPPPTATAATGTAGLPNQMVALMANQNQIIQQQQQQTQLTSTQNQKGFRRLPGHLQKTWLQASSRTHKDAVDANGDACGGQVRTKPTTGSQELFDAATNSLAKQQLQFDIQRKYAIQIEISDGAVAALREGLILNIGAGRLGAVNLFSVGEEDISSAIQSSSRDVTDFLELHIARTDGMGLSESQVKKAAKVHYHVPTNVDEGQRQLIGSAALLGHLFDQDN
jgi:hypothetical protein